MLEKTHLKVMRKYNIHLNQVYPVTCISGIIYCNLLLKISMNSDRSTDLMHSLLPLTMKSPTIAFD